MRIFITVFLAFIISLSSIAQTINANKSEVTFEVGNIGFNTVDGKFKKMDGTIVFDASDLKNASFNVCIETATVDTKNRKRDEHLKNEDFFNVDTYSKICFVSKSVTKQGTSFLTTGELIMCGVTKKVKIPFTFTNKTFTGDLTINRYEYNLGLSTNKFMVSEEVSIQIVCAVD